MLALNGVQGRRGRGARAGEEVGHGVTLVVEVVDDRIQVRQERIQRVEHRAESPQGALQRRQAGVGDIHELIEVGEQRRQLGRELADRGKGRRQVDCDRDQVLDQRRGVGLELVEADEGLARLALECGQDSEGLGQSDVLGGERAEDLVRGGDQIGELPVSLGQGVEDDSGVTDEALEITLLVLEEPDHVRGVGDERAQVAEGVVGVQAAVLDRDRRVRLPALERLPGLRVEGVEDLVDLGRILNLRVRELTPFGNRRHTRGLGVGDVGGRAEADRCRELTGLGPGSELDVGLAEQGLLSQDCARVLGNRGELRIDLDRDAGCVLPVHLHLGRRELEQLHLADVDPADPHVGLGRKRRRLWEVRRDPVALRRQRYRAAEGDPEEEEQAEAAEGEADRDHDPSDGGCLLLH